MNNDEADLTEEFEETKETRKKRLETRNKHKGVHQEQKLRPLRTRRPRIRVEYDPDFDEDDYDVYYE